MTVKKINADVRRWKALTIEARQFLLKFFYYTQQAKQIVLCVYGYFKEQKKNADSHDHAGKNDVSAKVAYMSSESAMCDVGMVNE